MWGQFNEVKHPDHRLYVRAYWRFLLGWGRPPSRTSGLDRYTMRRLRALAADEVARYKSAAAKGARIFYPFRRPDDDDPPPPASSAVA